MGKMTAEAVREMRRLYGEGATQGSLARHFGLGIAQVGRIVRGECWQAGAGLRQPTQAEADASLQRLLRLQEQINAKAELKRTDPHSAAILEELSGGKRVIPPSPLDGGDSPDETGGRGVSAIVQRAIDLGATNLMVKELKGE